MIEMTQIIDKKAHQALARALVLYLTDPNVALIDLGYRIEANNRRLEPELAVRFHVYEKYTGADFAAFSDRFPNRVIRSEKIDFPIVVMPTLYQIQSYCQSGQMPLLPGLVYPVLCGGMAITGANRVGFSTLGGLVQDRQSGAELFMSCWHGLFPDRQSEWPTVYQPGGSGIAGECFAVGTCLRHALNQHLDVAVARFERIRPTVNDQIGIGAVTGSGEPMPGMPVIKSGAHTGVTHGMVTGVMGSSWRFCRGQRRLFTNLVHIMALESDTPLCAAGDSGAWWLEAASRQAVAVHFAGSRNPHYALAFAMRSVLTALDVDLVGEKPASISIPQPTPRRSLPRQAGHGNRPGPRLPSAAAVLLFPLYHRSGPWLARLPVLGNSGSILARRAGVARQNWQMALCLPILLLILVLIRGLALQVQNHFIDQKSRLMVVEQGVNALQSLAPLAEEFCAETQRIQVLIASYNPKMPDSLKARIAREIYTMSKKYERLDIELLCATITHETGRTWNPAVVSPAGAIGLMQIMPLTGSYLARQAGLPNRDIQALLFDPIWNIRLGCRYLAFLIDAYGVDGGLAAYNGGMARAEAWLRNGKGAGILYAETALYVPAILRIYHKFKYQKNS